MSCILKIGPRIAGPDCEHGHTIGSEMLQWYSETTLPVFVPKEPKAIRRFAMFLSENG